MMRALLLVAALVAGASSFVFTCNEVKRILESDDDFAVNGTRACVVLPTDVKPPYNQEPYTAYLWNTYLVDTGSVGLPKELSGIVEQGTSCIEGVGPWTITSDHSADFKCTSTNYKYTEIAIIFTSDEPNIVQPIEGPTKATYGKGTHVFVTFEGSLRIDKNSIADGKETTIQLYSGAGQNEQEERFKLMPEKFVAGTSIIVLGPVTSLVIEDDVNIELTVTAFDDSLYLSAEPGFSYSIMTTGRASDYQSSRPSILVSTHYGIEDDTISYDAISVTGTILMDDNFATELKIDCSSEETGQYNGRVFDDTTDVIYNSKCTALGITYKGSIAAADIDRSGEVIYLRVDSNPTPVHKTTLDPSNTPEPTAPTEKTRRTLPPSSPLPTHAPVPTTPSRLPSSTSTVKPTTSGATVISTMLSALVVALLLV